MLNSSGHTHHYRRFAYPLARIHARLVEVCDWLHLHTTGLSPATFYQLAWRTTDQLYGSGSHLARLGGSNLPSGVYLVRLQVDGRQIGVQKVVRR